MRTMRLRYRTVNPIVRPKPGRTDGRRFIGHRLLAFAIALGIGYCVVAATGHGMANNQ